MRRLAALFLASTVVSGCSCGGSDADTTPPGPPAITSPADGTVTSAATVAISGTAPADAAVVRVLEAGAEVASASASGGAFSASVTPAEGVHAYTAVAVDAAGNVSGASSAVTITVDRTPPAAPALAAPADGTVTNASTLALSGTAPADAAAVRLLDAGVLVTTAVPAGGAFSATVAPAEGERLYTAVAVDAAGNASPASGAARVTVDRTAPPAPVIATPFDGQALGTTDLVASQVVFTGTAEPGAVVHLEVDGVAAGSALAQPGGAWSIAATVFAGPHTARARAADAAGNASPLSAPALGFSVDVTFPPAPVLASPAGPVTTNALALAVAGTTEPLYTVRIFLGATLVGEVAADAGGGFSTTIALPSAEGTYLLAARVVDAAGLASPFSAVVPVVVDHTPPAAPVVRSPLAGAVVEEPDLVAGQVVLSGTAEPGATVEVRVDGAPAAAAGAGGGGAWAAGATLSSGRHAASAVARDAAGNASAPGLAVAFYVNLTRKASPLPPGTPRGVVSYGQSVPSQDALAEVFPGQANTWTLSANFSLTLAAAAQYGDPEGALDLWVGTVGTTSGPGLADEYLAALSTTAPRLRELPFDQAAADVAFLSPMFGVGDGLATAALSPGASHFSSLQGAASGALAGTSDSRLARTVTLAAGETYTLSWTDLVDLETTGLLPGSDGPPDGPRYQVVLRDPQSGALLADPLHAWTSLAPTGAASRSATFSVAGGVPTVDVDLSFELRAGATGYAWIDEVQLSTPGGPVASFANGDFEAGLAPWRDAGSGQSQHVRSAPRALALDPAGASTLAVTRTFYAPPRSPWARIVDYLQNDRSAPVSTTVMLVTRLGATAPAATLHSAGRAVVVRDTLGDARDLGIVFGAGAAALDPAQNLLFVLHDVVVPPRGVVALVHYVVQLGQGATSADHAPDGTAAACDGIASGFRTDPAYWVDLEPGVLAAVQNL